MYEKYYKKVVHYSFKSGVAFDQGTLLTTPENVPFRLSRDIVDGMGICGIEGTFRKYDSLKKKIMFTCVIHMYLYFYID